MRLLFPDVGLFFSTLFVLRLCKKLLRPVPQINLHENGIPPSDTEVTTHSSTAAISLTLHHANKVLVVLQVLEDVETSDTESEDGSETEGSSFDTTEETTVPTQSGPPQFVQKLIVFAAGLRLLLSAIMNTAGKVVVTLLLGLAGTVQQLFCAYWSTIAEKW